MNDEQINQRIAEACGWTNFVMHPEFGLMGTPPNTPGLRTAVEFYTVDLNAMRQAEKVIEREGLIPLYIEWLMDSSCEPILATARQRAEAFLRMLGKWEEVQK